MLLNYPSEQFIRDGKLYKSANYCCRKILGISKLFIGVGELFKKLA